MHLKFIKSEDDEISVKIIRNDKTFDFNYADMVVMIYEDKEIGESETVGSFTDKEIQSIKDLTKELQGVISINDDGISEKNIDFNDTESVLEEDIDDDKIFPQYDDDIPF